MGRTFLAALAGFASLNISGLWLGYAGLSDLLKSEDQFAELCDSTDVDDDCSPQKKRLSLIYTCGSTALFASYVFHGIFLDNYGPRATALLSIFLVCVGQILLAFADSRSFDAFIPAAILIGFGGPGIHMAWMNFSNLFPKIKGSFISYIVSCFAASGLVYVLYHALCGDNLSRKTVVLSHVVIQACVSILVYIYYPTKAFKIGDSIEFTNAFKYKVENDSVSDPDAAGTAMLIQEDAPKSRNDIMREFAFVSLLFFFSLQLLRFNFYLSSALTQLEAKGDSNNDYLFALSIILPCGFIFIPVIGYIIDKGGIFLGWVSVQVFAMIFGLCILFENLPIQIVGFLAYSAFRIGLFSCMNTIVLKDYGTQHFGVLTGTVCFVGSLVSLLQYVATLIAEDVLDEDYFWCDVFMLALLVPASYYLVYLWRNRVKLRVRIGDEIGGTAVQSQAYETIDLPHTTAKTNHDLL